MTPLSQVRAEIELALQAVPELVTHPEMPTIQTAYAAWVMWVSRMPVTYCQVRDEWDVYVIIPNTNLVSLNEHLDAIVNDLIEALIRISDITQLGPETLPLNSDNTYSVIRARITTTA